jgi:hypothetical protein
MFCLLRHVTEGKIRGKVTGRRGRSNQLLDGLKKQKGYWKVKEEALDTTLWRTRFGNGYGPVVGHITERMYQSINQSNKQSTNIFSIFYVHGSVHHKTIL